MKNPLQLLLYTTYTRSVQKLGFTVNGEFNTQLTYGNLDMCFPKEICNNHRLIDYSMVTINESLCGADEKEGQYNCM